MPLALQYQFLPLRVILQSAEEIVSLQYLTRSKQYCLTRALCLLFDHMSGVEMTLGMLFKIIIIAEAQQSR